MRYISAAFIAAVLVGCSSGENNSRSLLVDFNGTVESPLYAYASLDSSSPVDTAILVDGQYRFHTDSWSDGFYRIASDPDNSFEIFIGDVDNVLINARRNHLDESTTNSYQTRMLWQVNNLASRMASFSDSVLTPSLHDSLFSVFRKQADDIRIHADTAMASLSLLQLSFHGKPLYDMVADHLVFENSIEYLNRKMPSDTAVMQLSAKVDSTREVASFLARYAKGQNAPLFHMTTVNNQQITNDDLTGVPYVFYLATDTSSIAESKWQQVALNRFNGMKVVAAIPSSLSRIHNLNVLQGSILPSEAAPLMHHQPLTIFVDEKGKITSMTINK